MVFNKNTTINTIRRMADDDVLNVSQTVLINNWNDSTISIELVNVAIISGTTTTTTSTDYIVLRLSHQRMQQQWMFQVQK